MDAGSTLEHIFVDQSFLPINELLIRRIVDAMPRSNLGLDYPENSLQFFKGLFFIVKIILSHFLFNDLWTEIDLVIHLQHFARNDAAVMFMCTETPLLGNIRMFILDSQPNLKLQYLAILWKLTMTPTSG